MEWIYGGSNVKAKRAPLRVEPVGFSARCFGLARDDVRRTRAFLALSDLELHLLAFVKSGVTFSLDF